MRQNFYLTPSLLKITGSLNGLQPQSRQSANLFSRRRNWDSPNPSPAGEQPSVPHPPRFRGGGGGTLACGRGGGSPNSDEGTYTVVLYIQYICTLWLQLKRGILVTWTLPTVTQLLCPLLCGLHWPERCPPVTPAPLPSALWSASPPVWAGSRCWWRPAAPTG